MSVLECDRNGCEKIMCDRLSHTHGYICSECFEELLRSNETDIEKFMSSNKASKNIFDNKEVREQLLEKEFPNRWEESDE